MKLIQASFLGTTHFFGVNIKAHDFKLGGTYCATGQSHSLWSDFFYKHFKMDFFLVVDTISEIS